METVKKRHAMAIGGLFALGTTTILIVSNNHHSWQALAVAYAFSFIVFGFYNKLLDNYPDMNIFEIIKSKYNNILGKVLTTIILLILLYQGTKIVYMFIDFITTINQLDFISKNIIMLINFILLGYVLKNNLLKICRFAQIIFISVVIIIGLLFLLGLEDINFENLLPIYPVYENKFFKSVITLLVEPFCEMTVLFNVFCKVKKEKDKKNIFNKAATVSLILIMIIVIEVVGILGYDYSLILNYPYYSAIASVNMNKIVIRVESLSLIIIYFSAFVKLIFIVYSILEGFNILANVKKRYCYPFLLLIHMLSFVIYDNIGQLKQYTFCYSLILLLINVLLPISLLKKPEKKIINHST